MTLTRCRVVLVRTQTASNVGAVARVMRNFGLSELVLVEPEADIKDPRAGLLATHHAWEILERTRLVASLDEAVDDCLWVIGTSARIGGLMRRQSVGTPAAIMAHVLDGLEQGPVALVFGPEDRGLLNAEVTRCHYLIHIPTHDDYAALNLAQAVAVCLYELRMAFLQRNKPVQALEPPAPFADQERMFNHLRVALEEIHFLFGPDAEALMHALRHLLGRAGPTEKETKILLGLARQLRWFAANAGSRRDDPSAT